MATARVSVSVYRLKAAEATKNAVLADTVGSRLYYQDQAALWLEVAVIDEKRLARLKAQRRLS